MKTTLTFGIFVIACLLSFNSNAQLDEHIKKGKEAYLKYADTELHQQRKLQKSINSYELGDTKTFWRWNLSVMPPTWIQEPATCRAVGEHSYVFVADAEWETSMTQDDVDTVYHYLEETTLADPTMGIVEMDSKYFGQIPDELDGDPKVIFFFSKLGSFNNSVFDGYFSHFNQLSEAAAVAADAHSNECEMLYMSCDPVNPSSYSTLSVLAHELEHLIHFGYDPNEESWVDEGCAEFAMVLFGKPDPITAFPSNADNNLLSWNQDFSDYVQTMLFMTYLSEQTTGPEFITSLVANPLNSVEGINSTLSSIDYPLDFKGLFSQWVLANFIDNVNIYDGIYGYEILNLPAFSYEPFITEYPNTTSNTLNDCAAHYYRLQDEFDTLNIDFTSLQNNDWDLHLITYDDLSNVQEVIPFSENTISFNQPETYTLGKLILVVTNTRINLSTKDYSFTIESSNSTAISSISENVNKLSIYPNPANDNSVINFEISKPANVEVDIFSYDGKHVMNMVSGMISKGEYNYKLNSQKLQKGVYFVVLKTDNLMQTQRIVVVK